MDVEGSNSVRGDSGITCSAPLVAHSGWAKGAWKALYALEHWRLEKWIIGEIEY